MGGEEQINNIQDIQEQTEQVQEEQEERNLYDDNIQDVFSIHDLENIKETGNINILAKTDKYVMFEAGKDFWKLDFDTEELVQYNDFISLKNNVNGNIVYSLSSPSLNKDYGIVLAESILNTNIRKDYPEITLKERQNYLEKTATGAIKYSLGKEFEKSIEKNKKKAKDLSQQALEPLNKPETKMLIDILDVTLETLTLFFTFFNNKYKQYQKEAIIKDIIEKLDNKELDIRDVLRNEALHREIPELKQVLEEWQKNIHKINIKTSISADDLLKKEELSKKEDHKLLLLPEYPINKEQLIEHLVDNKEVNEIAEKLSNSKTFNILKTEKFCNNIDKHIKEDLGENFKEDLKEYFQNSNENNSLDFLEKFLLNDKFLEELKEENPNISAKEYGLSVAYMNYIIDGSDINKNIVSEKLEENFANQNGKVQNYKNIINMVKKATEKIKKEMKQIQNKNYKHFL